MPKPTGRPVREPRTPEEAQRGATREAERTLRAEVAALRRELAALRDRVERVERAP
ncbi:MAG: hypothetical protein AAGF99_00485 [Bacteroidota bacterium]